MTTNLAAASIIATGTTTTRTLGARFADVINVKDFGALGDNSHNDAPNIQAAFDAAFGTSASPHGSASATSNKAVFFPAGAYKCGSTLTLTKVVGGRIFGSGISSTRLEYSGSIAANTALIQTNGCAGLSMENMNLSINGFGTATIAIDLNWDNTSGGDGLHSNSFTNMLIEGDSAASGIIVARSNNGGANNLFLNCSFQTFTSGIKFAGSAAFGNCVVSGGGSGVVYWCSSSGGSVSIFGVSVEGGGGYGIKVDSNVAVAVSGLRSEATKIFSISNGQVSIRGATHADPGASCEFANITGGKVLIDGCSLNANSHIVGSSGSLYLRGNFFTAGYHSTYSGTVVQEI